MRDRLLQPLRLGTRHTTRRSERAMMRDRILNLIAHSQGPMCDDCIADRLTLKQRQQAQRVTRELGSGAEHVRRVGVCSDCGESKLVTRRLPPNERPQHR